MVKRMRHPKLGCSFAGFSTSEHKVSVTQHLFARTERSFCCQIICTLDWEAPLLLPVRVNKQERVFNEELDIVSNSTETRSKTKAVSLLSISLDISLSR
jgi:hypothetical protein